MLRATTNNNNNSLTTTTSTNQSTNVNILIPNEYEIERWIVHTGSIVRLGDTIAWMKKKHIESNNETTTNPDCLLTSQKQQQQNQDDEQMSLNATVLTQQPPQQQQYKRATKRKRFIPGSATTTTSKPMNIDSTADSNESSTSIDKNNSSIDNNNNTTSLVRKLTGLACTVATPTSLSSPLSSVAVSVSSQLDSGETKQIRPIAITAPIDGIVHIDMNNTKTVVTENNSDAGVYVIGFVELCRHPTVLDGLCAVCGSSVITKRSSTSFNDNDDDDNEINDGIENDSNDINNSETLTRGQKQQQQNQQQYHQTTKKITVAGGITLTVSDVEGKQISEQEAKRLHKLRKLSLVLDLDHTLVHTTSDVRAFDYVKDNTDIRTIMLDIPSLTQAVSTNNQYSQQQQYQQQQQRQQLFVKVRPYVKEFLTNALRMYEIGIYTAGTRDYAEEIAMLLARHVVGCKLDSVDLDYLRHRIQTYDNNNNSNNNNNNNRTNMKNDNDDDDHKNDSKDQHQEEEQQQRFINVQIEKAFATVSKSTTEQIAEMNDIEQSTNDSVEGPHRLLTNSNEIDINDDMADKELSGSIEMSNEHSTIASTSNLVGDGILKKKSSFGNTLKLKHDSDDNNTEQTENEILLNVETNNSNRKRKRTVMFNPEPQIKSIPSNSDVTNNNNIDTIFDDNDDTIDKLRIDLIEAERLENKAIELRQKLFASRIVSRTDITDLGRDVKSLTRIFPCGGSMAVVVDDREDVWANATDNNNNNNRTINSVESNRPYNDNNDSTRTAASSNGNQRPGEPPENLLLVRPYHYKRFVGFADVNNSSGKDYATTTTPGGNKNSLTKHTDNNDDDDEDDEQLEWILNILKRLHNKYYDTVDNNNNNNNNSIQKNNLTVPDALRALRNAVLSDTNIVLSGLIPLHTRDGGGSSELNIMKPRPPYLRFVQSLGATIQNDVTIQTTHVIVAKDGTDKAIAGRKVDNCKIVTPTWLMECYWSMSYRDESIHIVQPSGKLLSQAGTLFSSSSSASSSIFSALIRKGPARTVYSPTDVMMKSPDRLSHRVFNQVPTNSMQQPFPTTKSAQSSVNVETHLNKGTKGDIIGKINDDDDDDNDDDDDDDDDDDLLAAEFEDNFLTTNDNDDNDDNNNNYNEEEEDQHDFRDNYDYEG